MFGPHLRAVPILLSRAPNAPTAIQLAEFLIDVLREAVLGPLEPFAGMNAIAAGVRGALGTVAGGPHAPPGAEELAAFGERLPVGEFRDLHATVLSAPTSFERAFEFGIRALARRLVATAPGRGCAAV